MRPGDQVVYLAEPNLYGGPGTYIDAVGPLMVIEFADGTRELFHPRELDTPERAHLTTPRTA